MKGILLPFLFWTLFFASNLAAQQRDSLVSIVAVPAKMGLLYIGVDNPISIYATGIPYDSLDVTISNGTISKLENDWYIARVAKGGEASIKISSKDNSHSVIFKYGVLRIPDPMPVLGGKYLSGDTLSVGVFKHQPGIIMKTDNFNFDIKCNTVGYSVIKVGASEEDGRKSVEILKNTGAKFNPDVLELINEATPGDIFIFNEIKARCPGDEKERKLNSLIFFMDDND
ncbi:MAG TPA: GldM family protein [Saprospiraceae bacterium]|nr:GldM family protein [Saprospiraceae bacterium]